MKHLIYIFGLTILLLGLPTHFVLADTQGWMTNTLNVGITNHLGVRLCHESRHAKSTYHGDPFLEAIQGGLVYKLPAQFYVGVLYRRENIQVYTVTCDENRATFEGGWTPDLFGDIRFISRIRVESRYFEQHCFEDHIRFRAKFGLSYKARFGPLRIVPFVATEVFGDDRDHWGDYPNRNRFFLGTGIPFGDHFGFTVSYVRQDTKGFPVVHALNTGINLSL